jgi:hypothetical protein
MAQKVVSCDSSYVGSLNIEILESLLIHPFILMDENWIIFN